MGRRARYGRLFDEDVRFGTLKREEAQFLGADPAQMRAVCGQNSLPISAVSTELEFIAKSSGVSILITRASNLQIELILYGSC